jgi:mannitol/fructose-specific phosphotransferase system IIA component (Ntr-type)
MAIALADLLDAKHVQLAFRSGSAENAIRELVSLLAMNEQVNQPEEFADKIIARERANPSVVEDGVVFPHVRTDLVDKIVLAIGRKRAGVAFGKEAKAQAKLIFLIGVPQRLVGDYLIAVGALARIARNTTIRDQLMKAPTPEEFVEILRTASSPEGG